MHSQKTIEQLQKIKNRCKKEEDIMAAKAVASAIKVMETLRMVAESE